MKVAALLFLALVAAPMASASHFRYGSLRWKEMEEQPENGKYGIWFSVELAFRLSWCPAGVPDQVCTIGNNIDFDYTLDFGDGNEAVFEGFQVTVSDEYNDVFMGSFITTHEYPREGRGSPWTATYKDCCRLKSDLLNNNPDARWHLNVKVGTGMAGGKSPSSSFVPIVQVGNIGWQFIDMVALPPEAKVDGLIWKLSDPDRMGGPPAEAGSDDSVSGVQPGTPSTYFIDESTGRISFDTTGVALGLWSTQVNVAGINQPDVSTPIDFFILVEPLKALCVDECTNSGVECSVLAPFEPCQGACNVTDDLGAGSAIAEGGPNVGAIYDGCQENIPPEIVCPTLIELYANNPEDIDFDVTFAPNPWHEQYQNITMWTGNMPPGGEFSFNGGDYDTGLGHMHLPKAFTATPNQFAVCFQGHDGFSFGPPRCTKINIIAVGCAGADKDSCRLDPALKAMCRWDNTDGVCFPVPTCSNYNKQECINEFGDVCEWTHTHKHSQFRPEEADGSDGPTRKLLLNSGSYSMARPHLGRPYVESLEMDNAKPGTENFKDGEWEPYHSCVPLPTML